MIQIKRILCPTDFSEFSEHALDQAVMLARWYGAEVTALHVFAVPVSMAALGGDGSFVPIDYTALATGQRQELELQLERSAARAASGEVKIHRAIADGGVIEEILKKAHALPADLVVMGTHGRSGFERLLLGSVTERVLRKAPCPVLTVPRQAGPVRAFKRILCPIDFSDPSHGALQYALSLAQEADARLIVAHVIELLPEGDLRDYRLLNAPLHRVDFERAAREKMAAAIPPSARTYCAIEEIVVTGKAYREILHLASAHSTDLIVMGVHGRGAADLMVFGSTTQQVVRQAACPVLSIRQRA